MNRIKDACFTNLMSSAGTALEEVYGQVREKYKDRPVCLMEIIEEGKHNQFIEVDFPKENATITHCFDTDGNCISSSIHFYDPADVDLYIDYLNENSVYYCYRQKYWLINRIYYMKLYATEYGVYFSGFRFTGEGK